MFLAFRCQSEYANLNHKASFQSAPTQQEPFRSVLHPFCATLHDGLKQPVFLENLRSEILNVAVVIQIPDYALLRQCGKTSVPGAILKTIFAGLREYNIRVRSLETRLGKILFRSIL